MRILGYMKLNTSSGIGMNIQKILKKLATAWVVMGALMGGSAHALLPENGWWWNPNESGRGFNLEIQNDLLYFSTFIYNQDGSPQWYTAVGKITSAGVFTGDLLGFRNGQCVECAYRAPTSQGSPGPVSIKFTSETGGTLTWLGRTVPIVRFAFGTPAGGLPYLLGEWAYVSGAKSIPVYFADRIIFNQTRVVNGELYAFGNRSGRTGSSNSAIASVSSNLIYILLDSSTSYYTGYEFTINGLNAGSGKSWTYLKTSLPAGAGTPFVGFRMAGLAAVMGNDAPSVVTRQTDDEIEMNADDILSQRAVLTIQEGAAETDSLQQKQALDTFHRLAGAMRQNK